MYVKFPVPGLLALERLHGMFCRSYIVVRNHHKTMMFVCSIKSLDVPILLKEEHKISK
jgi:hypothetical protein